MILHSIRRFLFILHSGVRNLLAIFEKNLLFFDVEILRLKRQNVTFHFYCCKKCRCFFSRKDQKLLQCRKSNSKLQMDSNIIQNTSKFVPKSHNISSESTRETTLEITQVKNNNIDFWLIFIYNAILNSFPFFLSFYYSPISTLIDRFLSTIKNILIILKDGKILTFKICFYLIGLFKKLKKIYQLIYFVFSKNT